MRTRLSLALPSRCISVAAGAATLERRRLVGVVWASQSPLRAGAERLAMAGALKKTTGLVGLAVSEHPHEHLRVLYTKILAALNSMPSDAAYRKYTEKIIKERFDIVKTEPNREKMESKINCGQLEEVILQAQNELTLARKMLQWRAWEPLVEEPPADQWKWPI